MFRSFLCLVIGALAAGGGFLYFTRDTHDADWWALECEREDLKGKLEICRVKLAAKAGNPDEARIRSVRETEDRDASRLSLLRDQARELRSSVAADVAELAALKENRIRETRRMAIGKEWAEFSSRDGRRYERVQVVAIDDGGVTLRHLHGSAKVRYADLSEEQRLLFGLEESASLAAEERERRSLSAYHDWVAKEQERTELRESAALATAFLSKPEIRRKPRERTWIPVPSEPRSSSPLKIGSLDSPPRKLSTSGRIFSRPRNNIYFYPYANGGGVCSPGYSNGSSRGWTFVAPRVTAPSPSPVNSVPTQ